MQFDMLNMIVPKIQELCRPMLREGEALGVTWDGLHGRAVVLAVSTDPLSIRTCGQFAPETPGASLWKWNPNLSIPPTLSTFDAERRDL